MNNNQFTFLRDGGEMGQLTRAYDWSSSTVGPPDQWPQSLRITVNLLLSSRFPMFLWWGDDMIQFYNDAYRPSLGDNGKHPQALGQKAKESWPEIWDIIYPLIQQVKTTGQGTWSEDQLVPIFRNGRIEDVYWTFGYSAVWGESGSIDGVLVVCTETTEKVMSQRRLEQSAWNLQNMILQAPVAMCLLTGPDHVIEVANQRMIELWGKPLPDVLGRPVFDALPDARDQGLEEVMAKVYRTGTPFSAVEMPVSLVRYGKPDIVYQNFVYEPYYSDGTITGVIALTTNVTDQVLAKKELQRINAELSVANDNFRNIILQAPVAMGLFLGHEMVIEVINDSFLRLWDKDRSVVGKPVEQALPEMKGQPYPEIMRNVFKTGQTYFANEAMVILKRRDKLDEGYYNFVNQAFRNRDGQIIGVVVVANEVTEQVKARKELEQTQDTLRLALSAAELGTFDLDLRKGYLHWDERCRTLFGITHNNPVTYDDDFVGGLYPEDRERVLDVIKDAFNIHINNGSYDVEYRTIGVEDRKIRWVRAKGKAYFDDNEQPIRFIGAVLDITEQKTDEIRKGDFIGMVSHELKTPLTTLTAVMQIAGLKLKDSGNKPLINAIERGNVQVKRMTAMIRGFLDISRLESGKMVIEKRRFDMNQLLQEVVEELSLIEVGHMVELKNCQAINVVADRDKISSVISNLIGNAAKYSPSGSAIKVKCEQINDEVLVSVQDEGIGIKKKDIGQIFDRYFRVEHGDTNNVAGFGIGLYLSSEIIKQHHGRIWAESEPGNGSTFTFALPL